MRIFIASSGERLNMAIEVGSWLEGMNVEPVLWNEPEVFPLGAYTWDALIDLSENVDAAIFIFGEDDQIWFRGESTMTVRDNVLLEYGLFSGKLSKANTIFLCDGRPKLASDLEGITWGDIRKKIICLTPENTMAPWINFEAGAIAKSLDSKVSALMINIKPSDIKGPLSRYQATRFEKQDFFQLLKSINSALDSPLELTILQNAFEAMWATLEAEANEIVEKYSKKNKGKVEVGENKEQNEPIEEVLQLLRKQSTILANPEMILPAEYMEHVFRRMNERNRELYFNNEEFVEELIHYINSVIIQMEMMPKNSAILSLLQLFNLEELISITIQNTRRKGYKQKYMAMRDLERRYVAVLNDKRGDITNRDVMSTTVIRKNNLEEEDR